MNRLEFLEIILAGGMSQKVLTDPNDKEGLVKAETVVAFIKHKGITYGIGFRLEDFPGPENKLKGVEFLAQALSNQLRTIGLAGG